MQYYMTTATTPDANPRTLVQVYAPQDQNVRILGVDICLQGATPATTPVLFDWRIQSSAGTATTVSDMQKQDRGTDETIRSTVQKSFTAEPTSSSVLIQFALHQQATAFWRPPTPMVVKGQERIGLRYLSGTFVPVVFTLYLEE